MIFHTLKPVLAVSYSTVREVVTLLYVTCAVQTTRFLLLSIYCFNHFANSDWIQLRSTIIEFNNINLYLCTLHFITRCCNNIPLKRSNTKPTNTRNNNYRPCLSFFIGDTLWRRMSVRKIKKAKGCSRQH